MAIAAFRYIMVCHAVFVQNHGGEKQVVPYAICLWDVIYLLIYLSKVWRLLISFLSALSLALGISIMFNTELNHTYLVCVGREEVFRSILLLYLVFLLRYELTNFYATPGPTGFGLKGPIWSPFRAFYNLTIWSMFIVVPICYRAIFKFRKVQDLKPGNG